MNYLNKNTKQKLVSGFTIMEVIIACSIMSISMFVLMQTAEKSLRLSNTSISKSQASFLLEEGAEVIKSIRDDNWTTISDLNPNTPYYLSFDNNTKKWTLSAVENLVDNIFSRKVFISEVFRDLNDDIVEVGGTLDPGTKKVTIMVNWPSLVNSNSKSLSFYISDIFN